MKKYRKNKKRTGPRPPRNDGEKTTVNRKLLWSRQNKRLPESLQKWGWRKEGDQGQLKERGKVFKTRPIRPKKSIKNSSDSAPQPMLWPHNKIYFHHQKSPRMGGWTIQGNHPQHQSMITLKRLQSTRSKPDKNNTTAKANKKQNSQRKLTKNNTTAKANKK